MNAKKTFIRAAFGTVSHWNLRRMEECATLIRWLGAQVGEQILDIGCGDGHYDLLIARSGARVTGIDLHRRRLARARRLERPGGLEFHEMDAHKMSFADCRFDKAVCFCVMEHLADDERVLRDVARVLRPGGLFVFSADSLSNPGLTEAERKRHRQRYGVRTFYTIDSVREKLDRAGFALEDWRYILTTPQSLALVRMSWRLDRLPKAVAPVRLLGYLVLLPLRWFVSRWIEPRSRDAPAGLTLLVRARKT
jgi:SAM-dependent methyltransferase